MGRGNASVAMWLLTNDTATQKVKIASTIDCAQISMCYYSNASFFYEIKLR